MVNGKQEKFSIANFETEYIYAVCAFSSKIYKERFAYPRQFDFRRTTFRAIAQRAMEKLLFLRRICLHSDSRRRYVTIVYLVLPVKY